MVFEFVGSVFALRGVLRVAAEAPPVAEAMGIVSPT